MYTGPLARAGPCATVPAGSSALTPEFHAPEVGERTRVPVTTKTELRAAAERLLEGEGARRDDRPSVPAAAAVACEGLVERLADFVGQAGARALFDRSLALARREHPCLASAVAVKSDPPWAPLRACLEANETTAWDASTGLLTGLITLFATFIGTSLATRVLHQYRPDAFPIAPPEERK